MTLWMEVKYGKICQCDHCLVLSISWIFISEGKVKDDIIKGSGSTVLGAALFVFNCGTTPDAAAEDLPYELYGAVGQ